jgi:hypothetical protein
VNSSFWVIPNLLIFAALCGIWHELVKKNRRDERHDNEQTGGDA